MSTLATTNIKHPSSASNNIVLDSSGGVDLDALTVSGSAPADSVNIDASGRLLVGTSTARTDFFNGGFGARVLSERAGGLNGSYAHYAAVNNENNDEGAIILLGKSRGTALGSATVVQSGDALGTIEFEGADGTDLVPAARIQAFVDGTPGNNDLPCRLVFSTTADGASSPTERMRINAAGGVGIGIVANSDTALSVSGISTVSIRSDNTQAQGTGWYLLYGTSSSGSVLQAWIRGDGTYGSRPNVYGGTSDAKLKENIELASSQWEDIKALQVKKFNFIGDDLRQIGVIAQEVEEVSPGLVDENIDRDEDGNDLGTVTKSVKYSILYMKAVKALQEAMERIEVLEQRLTDAGIA
jgi:hypothetical protein